MRGRDEHISHHFNRNLILELLPFASASEMKNSILIEHLGLLKSKYALVTLPKFSEADEGSLR